MYMWNQVNCTKNHYAKVGMRSPYNQWSYPKVCCPYTSLLLIRHYHNAREGKRHDFQWVAVVHISKVAYSRSMRKIQKV
jgi:hypothetical protein